jgi:hypothetical protein
MGHNVEKAENALDPLVDRKVRKLSVVGLNYYSSSSHKCLWDTMCKMLRMR